MKYLLLLVLPLTLFAANWELVWQDEFDGPEINREYWSWDTAGNAWQWGNEEDQYYTSERPENSRIENGNLIIEARKEQWENREYTSARLRTKGKATWLYGKVEIRAKLPGGKGSWPAFWMLPEEEFYGPWPNSGEIDIMEYVGYEPSNIYGTIHTEAYNHNINTQKGSKISVTNVPDSFRIYRCEWYPDSLCFYVDSAHVFTYVPDEKIHEKWPFNKQFHLLLNVAVGGTWGGLQGIDETAFPMQMVVDYVRIYKEIDTPVSVEVLSHGAGTVSISPQKNSYTIGETVTLRATPDEGKEFLFWNGTKSSTENPLTYVVDGHASFGASFRTAGEFIKNGDFSDSLAHWGFHTSSGSANITVTDTGALISVDQTGTNPWDIQIEQKGLSLEKGKTYRVLATMSSSDSLSYKMSVGMSNDPWDMYSTEKIILNKEKRTLEQVFTMTVDDAQGRFNLDLGDAKGTLVIHSVSLKEYDNSAVINSQSSHKSVQSAQVRGSQLFIGTTMPDKSRLFVTDLKGRRLIQLDSIPSSGMINLGNYGLGKGMYNLLITGDGVVLLQQKIVLK